MIFSVVNCCRGSTFLFNWGAPVYILIFMPPKIDSPGEVILEICKWKLFKMDSKHFNQETRTEDPGSDLEEFVAILDRIEAMKKLCSKAISKECGSAGQTKIMGNSEPAWLPSFEWEDFCARDHLWASSVAAKDTHGGIKIQEQREEERRVKQEVRGSIKRARDPVESAANFPCGKRHSPELIKAERLNTRGASFDLNSDDQEESDLSFTIGLPGFS